MGPLDLFSKMYGAFGDWRAKAVAEEKLQGLRRGQTAFQQPGTSGYARPQLRELQRASQAAYESDPFSDANYGTQRQIALQRAQMSPMERMVTDTPEEQAYMGLSTTMGPMNAAQFGAAALKKGGLKQLAKSLPSTARSFLTVDSPLADKATLPLAKKMLQQGFPADEILRTTGWSKNASGVDNAPAWVYQAVDDIRVPPEVQKHLDEVQAIIDEKPPFEYKSGLPEDQLRARNEWARSRQDRLLAARERAPAGMKWVHNKDAGGSHLTGPMDSAVDWKIEGRPAREAYPGMEDVHFGYALPETAADIEAQIARGARQYGGYVPPSDPKSLTSKTVGKGGDVVGMKKFAERAQPGRPPLVPSYAPVVGHEGTHALQKLSQLNAVESPGMRGGASLANFGSDALTKAQATAALKNSQLLNLTDEQLRQPLVVKEAVEAIGGKVQGKSTQEILKALFDRNYGKTAMDKYKGADPSGRGAGELMAWAAGRQPNAADVGFDEAKRQIRENAYWKHPEYRKYARPEMIPGSGHPSTQYDPVLDDPAGFMLFDHNKGPRLDDAADFSQMASEGLQVVPETELKKMGQGGSNKGTLPPVNRGITRFRGGRERSEFPGIYANPKEVVDDVRLAPEDPALGEVFQTSRKELAEMSRQPGNLPDWQPPGVKPGSKVNEAAERIMTPSNEQRIQDILDAAQTHRPALAEGMEGWYQMKPYWDELVQLLGPEEAARRFEQQWGITGLLSPGSDVLTEINRGSRADMLAEMDRFDDFLMYGGNPRKRPPSGGPLAGHNGGPPLDPADEAFKGLRGHAYHSTSQGPPLKKFLESGHLGNDAKVPAYVMARRPQELGVQTHVPVADAHWSRGVGLADTRTNKSYAQSAKGPEVKALGPWYGDIAKRQGLEAVPAQAIQWGALSRQTGVQTPVGAPTLELLARAIRDTAQKERLPLQLVKEQYMRGLRPIGAIDPTLLAGLGGASALTAAIAKLSGEEDDERKR